MARGRGFRLYHRVQTAWRWLRRGRGRYDAYLRLLVPDAGGDPISSRNPVKKLISWGRRCVSGGRRRRDDRPLLEYEAAPKAPPKGHLVVYVGGGWKEDASPPQRYVVPLIYFNHPLFGELLREAEEEFGHHHPGGITIPCPVARFEGVRTRIAAAAAAGGRRLRRSRS